LPQHAARNLCKAGRSQHSHLAISKQRSQGRAGQQHARERGVLPAHCYLAREEVVTIHHQPRVWHMAVVPLLHLLLRKSSATTAAAQQQQQASDDPSF
jgi:hypothetical protein